MLVLSRRPHQTIVFPTLGIQVEIGRIDGKIVRVGVNAPRSIPVLRGELFDPLTQVAPASEPEAAGRGETPAHRLRGRLNVATMALHVAQKQMSVGDPEAAETRIREALQQIEQLEVEIGGGAERPAQPPTTNRRLSALLVEDNPNESALLADYLRLHGVDVAQVEDGQAALEYLATHLRPDVVLLDMNMPVQDGSITLKRIRHDPTHHDLKVFIVSGSRPDLYDIPTGSDGADGWFTKPLNPPRLIEAVRQLASLN